MIARGIEWGGPYICRGCGVHHVADNPCERVVEEFEERSA